MKTTIALTGFKELERELEKLSKGMARGALTRAGVKSMAPMAVLAAGLAPVDTGELSGSIVVSAKAKGAGASVGKAAFAAAMRSGLGKGAAVAALRDARRAVDGGQGAPFVELFMGPTQAGTKEDAIKRIVQEFGSGPRYHKKTGKFVGISPPHPYMRPAWDQDRMAMLERLKRDLWAEVQKSVARASARAAAKSARLAKG